MSFMGRWRGAKSIGLTMDKLQLTGQNLGRVFNFRSGRLHDATFLVLSVKLPNLQLKTRPKQLLSSLPLVIVLPGLTILGKLGYLIQKRKPYFFMAHIFQPFHVIKSKCSEVNLAPLILREGYPKPQLPNNPIEHGQTSVIRAQCYKTFYVRNLQIFSISWSVCVWQIYQP
jgi:hypothetical protein